MVVLVHSGLHILACDVNCISDDAYNKKEFGKHFWGDRFEKHL
jgi:hypothetical protein